MERDLKLGQLESKLEKYAGLLVEVGLNVQEDGRLFIRASADALPLIRRVTKKAYEKGAKEVKGESFRWYTSPVCITQSTSPKKNS